MTPSKSEMALPFWGSDKCAFRSRRDRGRHPQALRRRLRWTVAYQAPAARHAEQLDGRLYKNVLAKSLVGNFCPVLRECLNFRGFPTNESVSRPTNENGCGPTNDNVSRELHFCAGKLQKSGTMGLAHVVPIRGICRIAGWCRPALTMGRFVFSPQRVDIGGEHLHRALLDSIGSLLIHNYKRRRCVR
jgi:hypothetical protein